MAVLGVWWPLGRRIMIYALTVHIAIGIWVIVSGLQAPILHYIFASLGWIGYMVANPMSKRAGRENAAFALTIASSVFVLVAFAIGLWAVKGG